MRCDMLIGRPSVERTSTAKVIRPSPPNWMSTITTAWPKIVSWLPGSNTTRPVTVTAEAAVKIASDQVIGNDVASGSLSSTAPATISAA